MDFWHHNMSLKSLRNGLLTPQYESQITQKWKYPFGMMSTHGSVVPLACFFLSNSPLESISIERYCRTINRPYFEVGVACRTVVSKSADRTAEKLETFSARENLETVCINPDTKPKMLWNGDLNCYLSWYIAAGLPALACSVTWLNHFHIDEPQQITLTARFQRSIGWGCIV